MTFCFYNPAPVLMDLLGLKPCANGSLTFCDLGTTTPKGTWSDPEKTTLNSNPVLLDSSGRSNTNIWLDGGYTVTLRDADGVVIWYRDVDSGQGAGATLPPMENGKFITTDGSNWLMQAILQVPDPSGSSGYQLGTDGANLFWEPKPELPVIPEPDIVIGANSAKFGTSDVPSKLLIQRGSSSAPASGGRTTAMNVDFPVAFKTVWHVSITQTHGGVTANSAIPQQSMPTKSVTGFQAKFSTDENSDNGVWNITSPVPFDWIAYGLVEEV